MNSPANNELRLAVLKGALIGHCLAHPVTGLKEGHIQQLLDNQRLDGFLENPILFPGQPKRNFLPGLHGELGQRLLAALTFPIPDLAGREGVAKVGGHLQELAEGEEADGYFGSIRNPGRPARRALTRWKEHYPWEEKDFYSAGGDSDGINPALLGFVAPCLGVAPEEKLTERLVKLTHRRFFPLAGALAVEEMTRQLMAHSGEKLNAEGLCREFLTSFKIREAALIEAEFPFWKEMGWGRPPYKLSTALEILWPLLREKQEETVIPSILSVGRDAVPVQEVKQIQHGFAPVSLLWAFFRALGPLSPIQAVEDVLNRGGETSAVTSLVLGLRVAREGEDWLPEGWQVGTLCLGHLQSLFNESNDSALEAWKSAEIKWTAQEQNLRKPLYDEIKKEEEKHGEAPSRKKQKSKSRSHSQEDEPFAPFAPPPDVWVPSEAEILDPEQKRLFKESRAKRRIDWKEERRKKLKDR